MGHGEGSRFRAFEPVSEDFSFPLARTYLLAQSYTQYPKQRTQL